MKRLASLGLISASAALLAPLGAEAQGPPPAQQPPTELVFEREVFTYPTGARRNPFRPLTGSNQGGPRFETLRVLGIIHSADPRASTVMLGTSTVSVSEDGTNVSVGKGQSWFLKVGQSIGNVRVVEIRRDQVVVEVEEFGLTEQKIMQLQIRRLGGTP